MTDKRDYNRNISEEINHKINSMNVVRNSRIQASKRLYNYNDHWKIISLILNIIAITSTISSLIILPMETGHLNLFFSSVFSIYTIIIQYYVSNLNYNERALRFEYQQLGIENFILELKYILIELTTYNEHNDQYDENVLCSSSDYIDTMLFKYQSIMQRYQELLAGYGNHTDSDYNMSKKNKNKDGNADENKDEDKNRESKRCFILEQDGSFSLDRAMIFTQYLIIILYIIIYLFIIVNI